MLISFDPDIIWKDSYRRNNRSRTQKHVLCFPNHIDNHHISYGFCGQSIRIIAHFPFDKADNYIVVGRFSVINGDQNDIINIGDTYDAKELKYSDTVESPFYPGDIVVDRNRNVYYLINSCLTAWRYSITLFYNKNQLISFYVYLFKRKAENSTLYECVESINSPSFKLCSSRRANHVSDISPINTSCVYNNNNNNNNNNNISLYQSVTPQIPPPSLSFPNEFEVNSPDENKKTPLEVCTMPLSPQSTKSNKKSTIQPETLNIKADTIIKYKEPSNNEEYEICRLMQAQTLDDPDNKREELDSYGDKYIPGTEKYIFQIDSKGNVRKFGDKKEYRKYIIFCEAEDNS